MSAIKPDLTVKNYTEKPVEVSSPNKSKEISAWVKPVVYTALGAAGVAATSFLLYRGFFSSSDPVVSSPTPNLVPTPSPIPSIIPTPTPAGTNSSVVTPQIPAQNGDPAGFTSVPTPTPILSNTPSPTPAHTNSSVVTPEIPAQNGDPAGFTSVPTPTPILSNTPSPTPAGTGLSSSSMQILTQENDLISNSILTSPAKPLEAKTFTVEGYLERGQTLLHHFKWNPQGIDFSLMNNTISQILSQGNLLDHEARALYHKCIEEIPTVLEGMEEANAMDAAYLANHMRSRCMSSTRNAMQDQFAAQYVLPGLDWFNHGTAEKGEFQYLVGKKGSSNLIQTSNAIIKSSQKTNGDVNSLVEYTKSLETDVVALGQMAGDNLVGRAIAQYPLSSLAATVGFTSVNLLFTSMLAMCTRSKAPLGSLRRSLPLTIFGGYFSPHMFMSLPSLSSMWKFATTPIDKLHGLLLAVDEQMSETGKALGQQVGDNFVGHALQEYPKSTLVALVAPVAAVSEGVGAVIGAVIGSVRFAGRVVLRK